MAQEDIFTGLPRRTVRWGKTTWAWLAATFFGIGLLGPGPGTWASVATVLIWTFTMRALHLTPGAQMLWTTAAAALVTLIGIPASDVVARESGREDPGHVVIDEVAGQLIALAVSPALWLHAALALLLFRIFDITKPAPARQLERLHGGVGIMMDDVAAGGYALLVSLVIHHKW